MTMAKKGLFTFSCLCLFLVMFNSAMAQDSGVLQDGAAFANSLKPTAPGQVVNSGAVNASAWSGNTSTSTLTTSNTGSWSSPDTSSSTYSGSQTKGAIANLGMKTQADCKNYVPTGDPVKDQQCAAVNFMANNCIQPNAQQGQILGSAATSQLANSSGDCKGTFGNGVANQFTTTAADSALVTQFKGSANNTDVAGGGCINQTVITRPATYATHQCIKNQIYDQVNCTQDLNPKFGMVTAPFHVNNGPQVAPWSGATFTYQETLNGIPSQIMLNTYKADNYGQLWINGQLVMGNTLPGMTDMRNGYVSSSPVTCDQDGNCSGGDVVFVNADGSTTGFYDDGCNSGCRGLSPARDITAYFQVGNNTITQACGNANGWGDCVVDITMQAYGVVDSPWIDNCTVYESAAGATLSSPE